MTPASVVNNVELIVAFCGLFWLFYGPWQNFVVDILRQNIFRLRDSLFLDAADGRISFSSPEYRVLRNKLNAMIRYAHAATWPHLLASALVFTGNRLIFDIDGLTANVKDRELARKMKRCFQRAIYYTMLAMVARSLFLIVTNMICAPVVIILVLVDATGIKKGVARIGRAIDADVEVEQGQQAAAA